MPRYYVKVLDWIESYARSAGAGGSEWQVEVFDDITEQGKCICYVYLAPSRAGPRVGLCGDRFFCEVGPDMNRPDTLFVSRVESADERRPHTVPDSHKAEFVLTTQHTPLQRDGSPIGWLFELAPRLESPSGASLGRAPGRGSEALPQPAGPPHLSAVIAGAKPVDEEFRRFVRGNMGPLLALCQPIPRGDETLEVDEFIAAVRRLWSRHRLERFARPSVRQAALLAGRIKPAVTDAAARAQYLAVFDADLLARWWKLDRTEDSVLMEVIEELVRLALPLSVRASLWCAALADADSETVRVSLHEFAKAVDACELEVGDGPVPALLQALQSIAERDEALGAVRERALASSAPLGTVLDWARRLQVRRSEDGSRTPPREPAVPEHAPGLPAVVRSPSGLPRPAPAWSRAHPLPLLPVSRPRLVTTAIRDSVNRGDAGDAPVPRFAVPERCEPDAAGLARAPATPVEPPLAWLLSLQSLKVEELGTVKLAMTERFAAVTDALEDAFDGDSLRQALESVGALGHQLSKWLAELPDLARLSSDLEAARAVYPGLEALLSEDAWLVAALGVSPVDAEQIAERLRDEDVLDLLPEWLWETADGGGPERSPVTPVGRRFKALAAPELRATVHSIVERLRRLDRRLAAPIRDLARPPDGMSTDAHLDNVVGTLEAQAGQMAAIPVEHRAWTAGALEVGVSTDSILASIRLLTSLRDALGERAAGDFSVQLAAADDWEARTSLLDEWVADVEHAKALLGGDVSTLSPEQWLSLRAARPKAPAIPNARRILQPTLAFEHNFVDRSGSKVPLVFRHYADRESPYGYVKIPVVVECDQRPELAFRLKAKVLTWHREAWPQGWRDPSPGMLSVNPTQWSPRGGRYAREFTLEIPVRSPDNARRRRERFRVEIEGRAPDADSVLVPAKVLEWETMAIHDATVPLDWPDQTDPDNVERQPIGPQREHDNILRRLAEGSSFAVVAPRRFGKSTLVDYLWRAGRGKAWNLLVPKPIVCTQFDEEGGLDLERVWRSLSDELAEEIGASIAIQPGETLPGPDAFLHVTRAAAARKRRAVVILIDEAQLLFRGAGNEGFQLGDRLKDRLERYWTAAEGGVPVLFGLVGLPSLIDRAGTNLTALLRPKEYKVLGEDELNRLILSVTGDILHTTRDARQAMVDRSGNLFVLKTLLEGLVRLVNDDGREWATSEDVSVVTSELRRALEAGSERTVANYMRDVLNDAESVNEWRPKPCFATAVAMASIGDSVSQGPDRHAIVARRLNEWCARVSWKGGRFPVYTAERVTEHLRTLHDLDVLRDESFASQLLEAYLLGCARRFPADPEDEDALFRGALKRVREPKVIDPVDTGGQAEIFQFTDPDSGQRKALRRVALRTPEEQLRFNERVETLGALSRRLRGHEGSQYVYDLEEIGLSVDGGFGLEIYRWVEGVALEARRNRLPGRAVAEIAGKLAHGLNALHSQDILHRDIRPRNVILTEETLAPVLVDFGLARLASAEMATVLADDNVAPEVRRANPRWGKAADVYSLGRTLDALLVPSERDNPLLRSLISACCQEHPGARPSAEQLCDRCWEVEAKLHLDDVCDRLAESLLQAADSSAALRQVLERFRPHIRGFAIGMFRPGLESCAEVALLLDKVLEASTQGAGKLDLGRLKARPVGGIDTCRPCIDFAHALRVDKAHWKTDAARHSLLRRHGDPDNARMHAMTVEAARIVGEVLDVPPLADVVMALLDAAAWDHYESTKVGAAATPPPSR